MNVVDIENRDMFDRVKTDHAELWLFFVSDKSANSREALDRFKSSLDSETDLPLAVVNAAKVRDIHPQYHVASVPAVLYLRNGKAAKHLEGKQSEAVYRRFLDDTPAAGPSGRPAAKTVVVYTTPTCPHCTTVKTFLRKRGVRFREVDVAKDTAAGERMTSRSGSAGVPQTEIQGRFIVGADFSKLGDALGIPPAK